MSRLRVTLIASLVVSALVVSGAEAHDGITTAADHAAEDAVTHTAAQERALDAHTRGVTALSAQVAAAAAAAAPQDVGQWGPVVDWPVVGVHVALLPNGKVLAYDSVGDNATETYPVHDHTRATIWDPSTGIAYTGQCRHRLQHLLQRSGASPRRADVHGRWKQGSAAQRHRPDSPLRFRDEPVEPRPEHGGRPLVSERHTTEQRRDAHHLGPRRYAGGPDAGRRPACAQHRVARLAVVSVDGRRAERPGLLFRSRPDDAHARHGRHRHVAGAGAARHDQPRLRRPRALRRGEDPRRRRWPLDQGRPGR